MGWSWPARFPLVQFPNPPLILALLASAASRGTEGDLHRYCRGVFYVAMTVWAYEEASAGVNWFRRLLGCGFLLYLALAIGRALVG